ncbi:hypothetical protein [Paenibacillus terrigena]|uniref:hypothetical protein n=1 Tax=Paenibacillus terrigena TaxID=369333 RepID=UPI000362B8C3|nr:hypothetical protein [Paenibacillus terrigena]
MNEIAVNQPPTAEEITAIYDSCILPMIQPIVQRNRTSIARNKHALTKLFVTSTDLLLAQIARDITDAKRILSRQDIVVQSGPQSEGIVKYRYSCRGFEAEFEITRDKAKAEISTRIARYIEDLVNVKSATLW